MDVPGFALITGAGSGIGKACAMAFAKEGSAGLALLDITEEALAEVKVDIEALSLKASCQILTHAINVTDETEVTRVIQDVAKTFGRIDYVVNAAGIAIKHQGGAAFAKTEDWKRVLDVNLTGTFFVLRESAKIMLKQDHIKSSLNGRELQRGSIITFGSIQAVVGITLSTAYTASKHAILGLTRSASEDYASQGLRINAICPGYTETPLTTKNPDVRKAMEERVGTAVPMQRMGRADEIADGVLYLAGGRSSFVTGTALMVDGGYTQR
jgi:NAD(P)-dependent dehydrogenase (short-subunit alcohol dehydrogenase family)